MPGVSEHPPPAVHTAESVHSFVRADPVVEVEIDGPRGTVRGFAEGWTGERVHLRWTEGRARPTSRRCPPVGCDAEYVEARLSGLRMGRTALEKTAGVDRKTVDNFLDRGMKPRTDKRGGYEQALGWEAGSLLTVARGGEPTVTEQNPQPAPEIPGQAVGPEPEGAGYVATGSGGPRSLSDLTLEELAEEQRRIADEMMKRVRRDGA
jgi:hypothetical protein